jgi:hypothetical protein
MEPPRGRADGGLIVAIEIEGREQVLAASTATERSTTEQALPRQARTAIGYRPGANTFEPDELADQTVRESKPEDGLITAPKGHEAKVSEEFIMENVRGAGLESSGG